MTSEIISRVEQTGERLNTRVGHSERKRHITTEAALAINILERCGWTIDFDPDSEVAKRVGLTDIWEHIAYTFPHDGRNCPVVQPTDRARWESVEAHAEVIERGFRQLKRHLQDDHGDVTLYICPRHSDRSRIEVLTLFPDYQINSAQTARDVELRRTSRQVNGQVRACARRQFAATGDRESVLQQLLDQAREALAAPLPLPLLTHNDPGATAADPPEV
jgi:hypothetical protein